MEKHKCDCGKIAVWWYMPSNDMYFCDDCVISESDKIGCSCNWRYSKEQEGLPSDVPEGIEGKDWSWIEMDETSEMSKITKEDGYWINLDDRGRPLPCVEYDYDEDGYDIGVELDKYNEDEHER